MKLLLIGAVVLVVVVAGALLLSNKSTTTPTETQNANPTQAAAESANESKEAAVSVTANGFEPATLTVRVGTNVVWTNSSGDAANVSSDNHPTHLRFPFLNLGTFENGQTVSVVFEKIGTYTYHNHLRPEQTGTVTVQ
ncbi:MAG: hypothetical protein A3B38_03370 [Candidatus Levybacteria bacterium RIFCSPLOWO2_01_FULL_36_13]|nr:MAG: hypothetical protein A2684_04315 [Candidatus Levybacteria bacterium RIFCSPHIGHO2_01_FULL_36_15b]OGH34720.1 MAG: hypothetical protein A3B38_03370 [Candidatus Levybacteria bacterium RIFCSPLOWO2_01_FULL_36_13]